MGDRAGQPVGRAVPPPVLPPVPEGRGPRAGGPVPCPAGVQAVRAGRPRGARAGPRGPRPTQLRRVPGTLGRGGDPGREETRAPGGDRGRREDVRRAGVAAAAVGRGGRV